MSARSRRSGQKVGGPTSQSARRQRQKSGIDLDFRMKDKRPSPDRSIASVQFPLRDGVSSLPSGVKAYNDNIASEAVDTGELKNLGVNNAKMATNAGDSRTQKDNSLTTSFDNSDGSTSRSHLSADTVGRRELLSHPTNDNLRAVGPDHVKTNGIPNRAIKEVDWGKVSGRPDRYDAKTHGNMDGKTRVHKPAFAAAGAAKSISYKDTPYNERKKFNDERAIFNNQLSTMITTGDYSASAVRNRLNSLFKMVKHLNHFVGDNPDMDSFELHTRLNQDNGAFRDELIRREGEEQDFASFFYRSEDGVELGFSPSQIFPVSSTSASVLNSSSISVPRPPGGVEALGDIVVLCVVTDGFGAIPVPSGWSDGGDGGAFFDGSNGKLRVFYKAAEVGFDPVAGNSPNRPSHYAVGFTETVNATAVCAVYGKGSFDGRISKASFWRISDPGTEIYTRFKKEFIGDPDPQPGDLSLWITAAFQEQDTRLSLVHPDDKFRLREEVLTPEREVAEGTANPAITLRVADNLYAAPSKFDSYTTPQTETIDAYISQRVLLRAAT